MAIVRAITDQQRRLGLERGLASLARVGLLGFRGEQRGENGSILFDIRTKELQRSIYSLYTRGGMKGNVRDGGPYSTKARLRTSKYY